MSCYFSSFKKWNFDVRTVGLTALVKTFRLGCRVDSAELVGGLGGAFLGRVSGLPWAAVFD